ncbi:LysM peptidoglycan-binding domain-containing protein [Spirosoma rhododendri]|uniref:LysM peptidoglycan-binding domain-containing protein n=1 Tax=Spirosoma rhododendri TaxID=2728024 RepID=A0A7L5DNG3_9BACT|nr:LysM peptidoglycan-binding domain-containing protein [Spirosoma rhododendri]QJD77597.1 LysM peptidoglycan-binding domain-containing protein [Spirosoma rhododendri]
MEQGLLKRLVIGCLLFASWEITNGQAVPQVPFDVEFAGVTVHINEVARQLIQQEVNGMYANRAVLLRDLETLRQLSPLLEARLAEDKLPADFRYAAMPFSDQTGTGYWGLTIVDAGPLKLRIDPSVDERFHPVLATNAVVDRLSDLQLQSGNYAQTLLQYLQSIAPTDRKPASKYATYLLLTEKNPPLLWKILARKFAVEREEPTFRPTQVFVLFEYANASGKTLASIARQLNLGEDRFSPFNQWLKTTVIPTDKRYPVLIRVTNEEFTQAKTSTQNQTRLSAAQPADVGFPVLVKRPQEPASIYSPAMYYTINGLRGVQAQPCDNVITMAYYGKMHVEAFIADNDLTTQDVIRPGQIYYLERKNRRAMVPFHVVQRGQTLRDIANMYGVRLRSLLKFNRLPANQRVQTGRIIWLQRKRPRSRPVEYQQVPELPAPIEPSVDTPVLTQQESDVKADTIVSSPLPKPVSIPPSRAVAVAPPARTPTPTLAPARTKQNPATIVTPVATPSVSVQSTVSSQRPAKVSSDSGAIRTTATTRRDTVQAEPREIVRLHVVKAGQTYYSIARQYGVAVGQLYTWNNLSERYPLEIGQEIIVSVVKVPASIKARTTPGSPVQAALSAQAAAQSNYYYYFVQPGQTAYRIALINKVSVEDLARWNNLKNYSVSVGQRLIIRKK